MAKKKKKGPDAPKVGPKKTLRLVDPLQPSLVRTLQWFEDHGGEVQMSQGEIAESMGTYSRGITRWTRWLEVYGALSIERNTGANFGVGSNPYRYHQLMSVADYTRDAREIREVVREKLNPKRKKPSRFPQLPLIEPDEMALIREQARAEVEASIRAFRPLPELREDPLDHIEAEAWRMAFNAD